MSSDSRKPLAAPISSFFRSDFPIYILIGLLFLFYLTIINDGHNWGDDFAMYIAHAQNIAAGKAYADTGYIYNPDFADLGPKAYPPIFPLMLSPLVALAGINLRVLKLVGVICFSVFQYVFLIKIAQPRLSALFKIMLLLLIGLHPFFGEILNSILSDIPFLLICYIALYLFQTLSARKKENQPGRLSVLAGILIYLAYGTRSIGICLLAVYVLFEWLVKRNFSKSTFLVIGISLVCILLQAVILPGTGSYFDQFPHSLPELLASLQRLAKYYVELLPRIIPAPDPHTQWALLIVFLVLAVAGFVDRLIHSVSVYEVFFVVYGAALFLWPSAQGLRFLLPILPLFFLYALGGMQIGRKAIAGKNWKIFVSAAVFCFSLFLFYQYYVSYAKMLQNQATSDITKPSTTQLFNYVRQNVSPADISVFYRPRALALFTGHKSAAIESGSYCDVVQRLKAIGAQYLIVDLRENSEIWSEYPQSNPETFSLVFENIDYQMYRIQYQGKCLDF